MVVGKPWRFCQSRKGGEDSQARPCFCGVYCGLAHDSSRGLINYAVAGDAPPPLSSPQLLIDVFFSKGTKQRMSGSSRLVFILMITSNDTDRDSARLAMRCYEWQLSKTVRWVFNFEKVVLK